MSKTSKTADAPQDTATVESTAETTDTAVSETTTAEDASPDPAPAAVATGLDAAEEHLAKVDEDVTRLWEIGGPKKTRIDRMACFLVTPPGSPPVKLIALAMKSGAFTLYGPVGIVVPTEETK